jgi:hypothetical protein
VNYIDDLAEDIYEAAHGHVGIADHERSLYRHYAVLCRAVGDLVTNEMAHDAWSAWRAEVAPEHRSIVPYCDLSPETKALDAPYRDAIKEVALLRFAKGQR